jgi:hypothetical protein
MDAAAQLAVMAKAKLVFETPGTFLSFPALSPLAFRPKDLEFSRALADPSVGAALQDFSRAVSRCPGNPIFDVDSDEYLWDHYSAWLNGMSLAESNLSPGDQAAYAAARALLVVSDANGLDSDGPVVVAYKQCRDAYLNAEQAYKAAQLTATASGDAALAKWQTNDEPRLRAAVAAAETVWATNGHQADVEAAQAVVARCEAAMPQKMWTNWRKAYNPDLDNVTDAASNSSYAPCFFAPANLVDDDWTTLHIAGPEMAALTAAMPKELREVFGDAGSSAISAISFEFRSASTVQPWFNPSMFGARFWKFADGSVLSDGAASPSGNWPAYIVAVVFVRNIQVTQATAQGSPQPPVPIRAMPRFELSPAMLEGLRAQRAVGIPPQPSAAAHATLQTSSFTHSAPKQAVGTPPQRSPPASASFAPRIFARRPVTVASSALQRGPASAPPQLRWSSTIYRMPTPTTPPAVAVSAAPASPSAASPVPTSPALSAAGASSAASPPTASTSPDDRISILAFICKLLPMAPNPDPSLNWSSKA